MLSIGTTSPRTAKTIAGVDCRTGKPVRQVRRVRNTAARVQARNCAAPSPSGVEEPAYLAGLGLRGEYIPLNLTVRPSARTLLGHAQQGWIAPAVHSVGHTERATMWHASCAVSDARSRHPLGLDHPARQLAVMLAVAFVRQR